MKKKEPKRKLSYLYGWVFTYNTYEEAWFAARRDNYDALWNGVNAGVLKSKSSEGVITKIKNLKNLS